MTHTNTQTKTQKIVLTVVKIYGISLGVLSLMGAINLIYEMVINNNVAQF